MSKVRITNIIAKKTGIDEVNVRIVFDEVLEAIQESMLKGDVVHFKKFCKFFVKKRDKKIARNLKDNTPIIIDEHYAPALRFSKEFANKIRSTIKD